MRKLLLTLLVTVLGTLCADAIPASPYPVDYVQPDGTSLTVRINGDEFYNYYTTLDGYTLLLDDKGCFTYARLDAHGNLVSTGIAAHNAEDRNAIEHQTLDGMKTRLTAIDKTSKARRAHTERKKLMGMDNLDYTNFRGLVILVEWSDVQFQRADVKDFYTKMITQPDYSGYTNEDGSHNPFGSFTGSVRDYFYDNSNQVFDPTFDVIGPVRLSYNINYPLQDQRMSQIMKQVFERAQGMTDFTQYDQNGDGVIDMFYVIFAGTGSNMGVPADQYHIWPHAWYLPNCQVQEGLKAGRYACSCELLTREMFDGIGVMCHEFSHVLGLPDLYDVDYAENGQSHDPGSWEIMANGGYNNSGRNPASYSAYDRYAVGFLMPTLITEPGEYTLGEINKTQQSYMLKTPVEGEYFLLENRQMRDWDRTLPGHGMIVARVDSTNAAVWDDNNVNINSERNYYELLRAGNVHSATNEKGNISDPFPGSSGAAIITNFSSPSLRTFDGTANPLSIVDIREEGGTVTFRVINASDITPHVEDFEPIATTATQNAQGSLAMWDFTRCAVATPGEGKCNGEKSVAMPLPSVVNSHEIDIDAHLVSFLAINPNLEATKFELKYSVDEGDTWDEAVTATGETSQMVPAATTVPSYWYIDKEEGDVVRYAVQVTAGNRNYTYYVDDFTVYEIASATLFGDVNGDKVVNVSDVNLLVSAALNGTCPDGYDLNGDGTINVTDINLCVSAVLNAK